MRDGWRDGMYLSNSLELHQGYELKLKSVANLSAKNSKHLANAKHMTLNIFTSLEKSQV